jgi:hypothetical protein
MKDTEIKDNCDAARAEGAGLPLADSDGVSQKLRSVEALRQQYTEVNNHLRHFGALRIASLTVYFAALGGLLSVAFGFFEVKSGNPEAVKLCGRIGGLMITLVFFYNELRIHSLLNHSYKVGRQLESSLGYTHLSTIPSWK